MVEERKSMFNINTLFGIAIGAILAYLLLKNNQEVIIVRSQKQESHILNWQPLKDIPSVSKLHYNTHQVQTEQLDMSEEPKAVNEHVQEQLDTSEELETTYKNDEKWKISRDSNGDTTEIKVVRNAKVK